MEEELNENELEERLYAMLHHVDETQVNSTPSEGITFDENTPRSTVRRYWRTNDNNLHYQKVNSNNSNPPANKNVALDKPKPKDEKITTPATNNKNVAQELQQNKEEKVTETPAPPVLKNVVKDKKPDNEVVELESSDEDEVVEVALPPKPTITIESSDDEDIQVNNLAKDDQVSDKVQDREVTASPVPSVVSSVSDEFIRGDCIALNISSKNQSNQSFDFSLHGSDLLGQSTPAKKKKKKKNKESPDTNETNKSTVSLPDQLFATPKSKAKNKKKNKSYTVTEKSIPNPDVYDSDSNQSTVETNKNTNYSITEKSLPNVDIYESDSSLPEVVKSTPTLCIVNITDTNLSPIKLDETPKTSKRSIAEVDDTEIVDLTDHVIDNGPIEENFVMANVTGFKESEDYNNSQPTKNDVTVLGSTKVPAILNEDLDFDNLKGNDKVCKRRRFSLTTLRAEMEKFYNESWGGEDFNHREIQKNMSRDKSLWVIDPKDRNPTPRRKPTCNYCNRVGHRDETCYKKPPICYMCGCVGHYEPRCPQKICVNCGSPNYMYSTLCRNCSSWNRINCAECGQFGHPSSHCPDIWRRYHNTIDFTIPLEDNRQTKKRCQLFCSGCARLGHLVHTCRTTIPFSGHLINSPYVVKYRALYQPTIPENPNNDTATKSSQDSATPGNFREDRNKRQSKSPTVHESHMNKKRNVSDTSQTINISSHGPRKTSQSKDQNQTENVIKPIQESAKHSLSETSHTETEKAPDFIPIISANHDKKGHIIQDNEVSDTSDAVTLARIYMPDDTISKIKTTKGQTWLNDMSEKHNITVQHNDITSFLNIKGKFVDQEAFQADLKVWAGNDRNKNNEHVVSVPQPLMEIEVGHPLESNIPKNRNNILRILNKAFDSLKGDLGDPSDHYKELTYLQNRHMQLLKQKVISPKQVTNNRNHINEMLKKLNMVLLGQAGLAEGSAHLTELYALQEKLINFRQKNIPMDMRREIGTHYHYVFSALPRDDYVDLLKKYLKNRPLPILKKKKKEKSFKVQRVPGKMKSFKGIPSPPKNGAAQKETIDSENSTKKNVALPKSLMEKTFTKLSFYRSKILKSRPTGPILMKTRLELVKKLHLYIKILGQNGFLSQKTFKKVKKTESQAQLFLTNV